VRLGLSRVALSSFFGTVSAWRHPWFSVEGPGGRLLHLRPARVAASLLFDPRNFLDPRRFYYDWSTVRPYLTPGWRRGLADYALSFATAIPAVWLDAEDAGGDPDPEPADLDGFGASVPEFLSRERAHLSAVYDDLAGHARAPRTVRNLKNPALKLLWFLASRGRPLPPSAGDLIDYLAFLSVEREALGAITAARGALLHLCRVNRWPTELYCSGAALIPGQAMARLTRHQVKKSAGLRLVFVKRIVTTYCFVRRGVPASGQWELAIGVGILVSYCVFARWDDGTQLRWDVGYYEETESHVRFYLDHRKNAQHTGNFLDIARPSDPGQRGAYHVIREARALFQTGHVLAHVSARGVVDTSRYMAYDSYVRNLRHALTQVGVPVEEARLFAGQSARSGAATESVQAGISPGDLCRMAGVTSINWLLGYMRPDQHDRLEASRKIGL
jgi:hypothetical protein